MSRPAADPRHDDRALAELARELPWHGPDAARCHAVRDAVVLAAQDAAPAPAPAHRRRWIAGAAIAGLAAALALAFALGRGGRGAPEAADPAPAVRPGSDDDGAADPTARQAVVQASSAADFVHGAARAGGVHDEVVRLRRGRVSVQVARLAPDERFRVVAGDGEVEVRGTAFDVEVIDDRLHAVIVHHGLVEVRLRGAPVVAVAGGQAWTRPAEHAAAPPDPEPALEHDVAATGPAAAAAPPPPAPAVPSPPATAPPATAPPATAEPASPAVAAPAPVPAAPAASAASATEDLYRAARAAQRAGDFGTAADLFARAIAADPDAPLAEDARYGRGIALARAGRDAAARAALEDFLDRHPRSLNAGRAALVLGRLLLAAGDLAAARARLDAAAGDPDPDVAAAARAARDAIPPR